MHDITNIVKKKGIFNRNLKVYGFESLLEMKKYINGEDFLFFIKEAHYMDHEEGYDEFFLEDYRPPESSLERKSNSSGMITDILERDYILCDPIKEWSGTNIRLYGKLKHIKDNYDTLHMIDVIKYKKL